MADDEPKQKLFTPSKRGKKPAEEAASESAPSMVEEEEETETATTVDDGLPHPRVSFYFLVYWPLLTISAIRIPP